MNDISTERKTTRQSILYTAIFTAIAIGTVIAVHLSVSPIYRVADAFAEVGDIRSFIDASARLIIPTLAEFLAVYVFAFSPLSLAVSLGAVTMRAVRVGIACSAMLGENMITPSAVSFCLYALSALTLAVFAAFSSAKSPHLRTVLLSSENARRDAAVHTIRFLTLSGVASLLLLAAGSVIHLA